MLNLIYLINFIIILKPNNNKINIHNKISWKYSNKSKHFCKFPYKINKVKKDVNNFL
jgi:hypothetical protein